MTLSLTWDYHSHDSISISLFDPHGADNDERCVGGKLTGQGGG